jgi:PTS system N-acetylgalactosamine-specific IIA component
MSSARAVVAAHGELAAGLVSAVQQITGRGDVFAVLSNRGLGAADVQAQMAALVRETGAEVVFTDLPAGSCTMAARRLQREMPGVSVVVGVNLVALLDFVFAEGPAAVAAGHAVGRGREALNVIAGGSTHGD